MIRRIALKSALAALLLIGPALTSFAGESDRADAPTFARDVAPIMHSRCVTCHRPGDIGPMSLITYDEVRPWAKSIREYVGDKVMPPWHADPGFGPFSNDRSLSQHEIDTIVTWIDRGSPLGDKSDLPEPPVFDDEGWRLGEPDYIIEFDAIEIAGDGPDRFYDLRAKTDFPEDRWITGVEIIPGNRQVVHHMILWQGQAGPGSQQGWMGAWAAGADPGLFPEGTGRLLKKGATLIGDMHYHPIGETVTDQTKIGLHFADGNEVEKELVNLWVMNAAFEIPAGDDNYEARSSHTFSQDSHIISLTPHMHYRGKDFDYTATYPDGRTEKLLEVSRYDFNWQTAYLFEEPLAMPKGTRIDCVAHWDNSDKNPSNPDPTKTVRFGLQSYDEMMIGFVDYIVDEGVRPKAEKTAPMEAKIAELVAEHPGEVFRLLIQQDPSQPMQLSALHVPREGEGGWYVPIGTIVGRARVHEIKWNGNDFECKVTIPGQGTSELKGTADPDGGLITVTMTDGSGNSTQIPGTIAR